MFLLLVLVVLLPSSEAFVDCRLACRRCRENREHAVLLEVHCAMCEECKLRRKEKIHGPRLPQPDAAKTSLVPMFASAEMKRSGATVDEPTPSHQEEDGTTFNDEQYPEGCPTPPECESEENPPPIKLKHPTTTERTCPPITSCRKKLRTTTTTTTSSTPSCMTPCMPMCVAPCLQNPPAMNNPPPAYYPPPSYNPRAPQQPQVPHHSQPPHYPQPPHHPQPPYHPQPPHHPQPPYHPQPPHHPQLPHQPQPPHQPQAPHQPQPPHYPPPALHPPPPYNPPANYYPPAEYTPPAYNPATPCPPADYQHHLPPGSQTNSDYYYVYLGVPRHLLRREGR